MKFAASFFAAFCGWAVAFILLMIGLAIYSYNTFGYISDFEFLLRAPLIFTAIGWMLFGVPFVHLVRSDSVWLRWPRSALTGLLLSSGAYCVRSSGRSSRSSSLLLADPSLIRSAGLPTDRGKLWASIFPCCVLPQLSVCDLACCRAGVTATCLQVGNIDCSDTDT